MTTFYGIGVGPGDPDLLTVKAVKVINAVDVVFAAGHERSGKSLALEIAAPHIPQGKEVVSQNFPHTFESVEGREYHRLAAEEIAKVLKAGKSAAFLTLGDPMTFSTFTYVLEEIQKLAPEVEVKVVPGVTSFASAAAETLTPLAEGEEVLAIMGAARGGVERLKAALAVADNMVIMKPYRQTLEVCDILEENNLGDNTLFCTECSRPTQIISKGLDAARNVTGRYMSLFLVKKGKKG